MKVGARVVKQEFGFLGVHFEAHALSLFQAVVSFKDYERVSR